jgi:hypothetical protein
MSGKIAPVIRKKSLFQHDSDFDYWQSRPCEERIAMLEEIRREFEAWQRSTPNGDNHAQPGLQRVYRIIKR